MNLHCHSSSRELGYNDFHDPCKLSSLYSPSKLCWVYLRFNGLLSSHNAPKSLSYTANPLTKHVSHRKISSGSRLFLGFKLPCVRNSLILPGFSTNTVKGKKNGGDLPVGLKSLKGEEDVEKVLKLDVGKLSPKEQTMLLKEQGSWERLVRVFNWMRSHEDYTPNVIHYNMVLRSLGLAQRWDELRFYVNEMATDGVLPTNHTYSVLIHVYGKAGLVEDSISWIKDMRVRRIFPDEVTMSTIIKVLKDADRLDMAIRFYRNWCDGKLDVKSLDLSKLGGKYSPSDMAVMELETVPKKPRLTTTYNALIDLFGKAGLVKSAAKVFADMLTLGVSPDKITFNTMIHISGTHGYISEAEALLWKMEERGLSPDTKTYNTLISLSAQAGNVKAALKWYQHIRKVNLFPDVVTYRTVLLMLCEKKRADEAETVIGEMEKGGFQVHEQSIPGIIKMYVNLGYLEKAKMFWEKCQVGRGFSMSTYRAIIDVYADMGLWTQAEEIFYAKTDLRGKKNDVLECNALLKAYGKGKRYEKALRLFASMASLGTCPDECTYNSLAQMLSVGNLVHQAKDILAQMQKAGLKPQCQTFSAVIGCYARLGLLSDAIEVFRDMSKAGIKPNEVVYGALINGFAEAGRTDEAVQYYRLMVDSGIPTNQIVLTSLIKAYSKGGHIERVQEVYESLKHLKGGPDIVASNTMINVYGDAGMISEAEVIYDKLRQNGEANGATYATMMSAYRNMGMIDEAVEVAGEMKSSGLLTDCMSFTQVMACYAGNGELVECVEIFREMISQNVVPDSSTFNVLFKVLTKGGMSAEAVFQLEAAYSNRRSYATDTIVACVFSVLGWHGLAVESFDAITKGNFHLDRFVYSAAIYAYGICGETDKALNMFMRIQDEGYEPDLTIYIHLVICYGKASMVEGVKRIYYWLRSGEIETKESILNAIINAFGDANRPDLAKMVRQEKSALLSGSTYFPTGYVSESEEET